MKEETKKIFVWTLTLVLVFLAMLVPAFADEIKSMVKKEQVKFLYPHQEKEHIIGAEKTCYYVLHFDKDGSPMYAEAVRIADDFVFLRVYSDGRKERFSPPDLTQEQIERFNEKYLKKRSR